MRGGIQYSTIILSEKTFSERPPSTKFVPLKIIMFEHWIKPLFILLANYFTQAILRMFSCLKNCVIVLRGGGGGVVHFFFWHVKNLFLLHCVPLYVCRLCINYQDLRTNLLGMAALRILLLTFISYFVIDFLSI